MAPQSRPVRAGLPRREAMALAGAAAIAAARPARADTKLTIWTGFPEVSPGIRPPRAEYAKTHPGVSFDFFSTSLREAEQKLTAAVPTGTGPDIYDIGTNISVNFIDSGLIDPNPPEIDAYLKSPAVEQVPGGFLHHRRQDLRPAAVEGSRACMFWNKTYFQQAGMDGPPKTFPELIDARRSW